MPRRSPAAPLPVGEGRAHTYVVRRRRLEARLDEIVPGGVGLVVASAGSGKTALLTQWAASAVAPICSLTLTPHHNDAVVLARDLVGASHGAAPDIDLEIARLVSGGGGLGAVFVDELRDALAALAEPLVIVLDDLHRVTEPAVLDDIGTLLTTLPPSARAVVGTRWDPAFGLARLRVDGRLIELRAVDLAMDGEEARTLLVSVSGHELDDRQVAALVDRTDGWAAGLQLAGVSLQGTGVVDEFVDHFAGDDRLVAEFLTEEVLAQQEPAVRDFLLATSVLDWLSGDLCDAVTGRTDGRVMLESLAARSLFVIPLDATGSRHRYHHLFADLLRYQLRGEGRDREHDLRRRAARWLDDDGWTGAAIDQYLAAGEVDLAFTTLLARADSYFERSEAATIVGWLTTITRSRPDPPAIHLVNLLAAQTASGDYVGAAATYRVLDARSDLTDGERVTSDALFSTMVMDDLAPDRARDAAARVTASIGAIDPASVVDILHVGGADTIEAFALHSRAIAAFLDGEVVEAAAVLEAMTSHPATDYPIWRIHVLGSGALVAAWLGRGNDARRLAEAAIDTARTIDALHHTSTTFAYLALGLVALDRNETDPAGVFLHEAARAAARSRRATALDLIRLVESRLVAATEGPATALAVLAEPGAGPVEAPILFVARRSLAARLRIDAGEPAHAAQEIAGLAPTAAPAPRIALALIAGDTDGAQRVLEQWHPPPGDVRSTIERTIHHALVLDADGHRGAALSALADAVTVAEPQALRQPFLDAPVAIALLRTSRERESSFVQSLVAVPSRVESRRIASERLVVPLSPREQAVLDYLPTRLTNTEIASDLYVSVNTLKTHLRNIYRKLEVADRDHAITRATQLGLL